MAASAWELYNSAIGALGEATMNLSTNIFYVQLHKSSSNASDVTLSIATSLDNEVDNGFGYVTDGTSLSTHTWVSTGSGVYTFDASDTAWTASGGAITSIDFAVIMASGASANARTLLCKSNLTTTGTISVGDGGTLTLQYNASGIFTLS